MSTKQQIPADLKMLHEVREIADLDAAVGNYKKDQVVRLSTLLKLSFDERWTILEHLAAIQTRMLTAVEITVEEAPKHMNDDPNAFDVLDATHGIRCNGCGEVPIVFHPDFNPFNPRDAGGFPLACHLWTMRFRGFAHHSAGHLFGMSREFASCTCCNAPIPFFGAHPKTQLDPKFIVEVMDSNGVRNPAFPFHEALVEVAN